MNFKNCLMWALGLSILVAACKKPDDPDPAPIKKNPIDTTHKDTTEHVFTLLKLGNYWLYDVQVYNVSVLDTTPYPKAARVEIKPQAHLASNEYYFELKAAIGPIPVLSERFVCQERNHRMYSSRDLDSTVRQQTYADVVRKPLHLNDTWENDSLVVKVTHVNLAIPTPAGTFICNKLFMKEKKSNSKFGYYFDTAFKYFAPLIEYYDTSGTKILYRLKMSEKNN